MKPIDYEGNGNGLFVQYHRMREGPNYFVVAYKNSCVIRRDPKDAWRVTGAAKFTASAQDLKNWCIEQDEKYNTTQSTEDSDGRADTSFASEAQHEEPNDNTKMIT